MSYFPLDREILTSSLWAQGSPAQLKVFLYLLLRADPRTGVVPDSEAAIALHCGLGDDVTEEAIEWLMSPDPKSRSKLEEGCRIKREDCRLVIVNHLQYSTKDYSTPRVQRWREKKRNTVLHETEEPVSDVPDRHGNYEQEQEQEHGLSNVQRERDVSPYIKPPPEEKRSQIVEDDRALPVWRAVLKLLEETVPEHNYATWLRPTTALGFQKIPPGDENWALVVEVPNEEFRAHIWETYGSRIRSAMKRASPGAPDLLIVVGPPEGPM